jgi:GntR family transcriptional regulator, transcriptional repressor for pyruvate dehydrogenase complex
MGMKLKPIRPKRISDQVFDQLRDLIFRGALKPGDRIMPERDLSEALGVSRTSVRDAIRKLVVMGFLEQRQGQGTFVRSPGLAEKSPFAMVMENQDATLIDLLEVRMGMECNAAALAARRADDKDIRFLETSLAEMREDVRAGKLGNEADVSFHMAISYATKNPLQIFLMKNFFDYLFMGIKVYLKHLYDEPGNIPQILAHHTRILEAIRERDPEEAFEAMREHITFVMDFFRSIRKEGMAIEYDR